MGDYTLEEFICDVCGHINDLFKKNNEASWDMIAGIREFVIEQSKLVETIE